MSPRLNPRVWVGRTGLSPERVRIPSLSHLMIELNRILGARMDSARVQTKQSSKNINSACQKAEISFLLWRNR
jgi:hypothetical protein